MPEQKLVRPSYHVEIKTLKELVNGHYDIERQIAIVFKDKATEINKVAIVTSQDQRLIQDIASIVQFSGPVTEEIVHQRIRMYSARKPIARLTYTGKKGVICEEPSCMFHFDDGCVNPDVLIEDDCAVNSYCLTYEQKEGFYDQ